MILGGLQEKVKKRAWKRSLKESLKESLNESSKESLKESLREAKRKLIRELIRDLRKCSPLEKTFLTQNGWCHKKEGGSEPLWHMSQKN